MTSFRIRMVLFLMTFSLLKIHAHAQEGAIKSFSLKEAQEYAVSNSYKTRASALDVAATEAQRKQFISIGLPQISGNINYQYYINIPTQLMPNFLTPAVEGVLLQHHLIDPSQLSPASDQKFEVQFGSKNNLTASATLSQLLFDGTFVVGLKAAALLVDMSKSALNKSEIDIKASVAQAYYLALVATENFVILDSTYYYMARMLEQTKEFQKNGFVESTDVDQMELNVTNLKSKVEMARRNIELTMNLLKFQMGIDISENIVLEEKLEDILGVAIASNILEKPFDYSAHIDYKIMKTQERLLKQNVLVDKAKYYPSMNVFLTTQESAQRNTFNFLDFKSENKWYNATIVGVGLNIPIWSSGNRYYKVQMDKFNLQKQQVMVKQVQQGLEVEVANNRASLRTYTDQYYTDKRNFDLSVRIYRKIYAKYREGLSSSMDLNQAYLQVLSQEGNYMNTMLQLLNTYTNLNKALNNL